MGSATPFVITRLHIGSLALQPAGLLDSLNEPLLRNLVFWVIPHTSFKLHGRTAEFPWSDFDRQVMRRTPQGDVDENREMTSDSACRDVLTLGTF